MTVYTRGIKPRRSYLVKYYSRSTRILIKENLAATAYKPQLVENGKYEAWERDKLFEANVQDGKPTFSMVLPPPNVTGKLHLGHALACTVQDVIARHKRSQGYNVMWLPGTDHAGIATQGVVEKYLMSKNKTNRWDLGREKFNLEVWKWKEKYGENICHQLRHLGCSLDWSRQIFTMDPKHTKAVNAAFIKLFNKGLIYRKKALVNWCYDLKSTVSDIEVDFHQIDKPTEMKLKGYDDKVQFGLLYSFAYKICDSNEEIVVSTTMPETMLGDVAIAVHPNDERYTHLRGKHAIHPFRETTIPIIFDEFVDMKFGSGAVKITPAHSKIDYEVSLRHNLPLLQVIDESGRIMNCERFKGIKKYEGRQKILDDLSNLNLFKNIVPHSLSLPICSRSGGVIEYLPKEQWFLNCKELNKKCLEAVEKGDLKLHPGKFQRLFLDWVKDDRDWCISRQLWWGHQIPAYFCEHNGQSVWIASETESMARQEAGKNLQSNPDMINVKPDLDVLDTWFSSGIYPISSLGWPEKSKDYDKFYPLNLMATGHDILGFWVHRMVILGQELTGKLPFKDVLLHGVICDNKGAKMSKSKGNVIDPMDVINGITLKDLSQKTKDMFKNGVLSENELKNALAYHRTNFSNTKGIPECGVDALRLTILSQDITSHYVHFDVDLCLVNKLFCNKIWQSVKYTQMSFEKLKTLDNVTVEDLTFFDHWILSKLGRLVETVEKSLNEYEFHIATKNLKRLLYNDFCDLYLEATKPGFDNEDPKIGYAHAHTLSSVLHTSLRCLSPFMIYLTHELIPRIPSFERNIIHNYDVNEEKYFAFPKSEDFSKWINKDLESRVNKLTNVIDVIRQLKGFYNISNKMRPKVIVNTTDNELITDLNNHERIILNLTKGGSLEFEDRNLEHKVTAIINTETKISVEIIGDDVEDIITKSRDRLNNKIRKVQEGILKLENRFLDKKYLDSASEVVQNSDKENLVIKREELQQLRRFVEL